ncbi:MAG: SH3 domain-containing protein, partial [Anaerolineales bacterium]
MQKIKKITPFVILILALVLAACGPTATQLPSTPEPEEELPTLPPEPTATPMPPPPEPTAVPTPTATAVPVELPPGDPATLLGTPDGEDNFETTSNWTGFDNDCFTSQITGGQYVITAKGLKETACWEVSWPLLDNFYLETQVNMPETCDPQDRFGMLFRAPDNNRGYLYGISCAGEVSMTLWDGQQTTVIIPATGSTAINVGPGQQNRLGLAAYGGTYLLYVNGAFVAQGVDSSFLSPGKIGYFVRSATDQSFTTAYDYLKIWSLSDAFYPPGSTPPADVTPIPPPASGVPTVTTTTYVNVRSGPGLNYPIYFVAEPGASGEAVGISQDGGWYAVNVPEVGVVWVSAQYVTAQNTEELPVYPAPPVPPTVQPPPPQSGSVTGITKDSLSVRSGPAGAFPSYGKIPMGTTVTIVGQSDDLAWYAIAIPTEIAPDGIGWIKSQYVELVDPNANIPNVPPGEVPPSVSPPPPAAGS